METDEASSSDDDGSEDERPLDVAASRERAVNELLAKASAKAVGAPSSPPAQTTLRKDLDVLRKDLEVIPASSTCACADCHQLARAWFDSSTWPRRRRTRWTATCVPARPDPPGRRRGATASSPAARAAPRGRAGRRSTGRPRRCSPRQSGRRGWSSSTSRRSSALAAPTRLAPTSGHRWAGQGDSSWCEIVYMGSVLWVVQCTARDQWAYWCSKVAVDLQHAISGHTGAAR
jgi:hypothetical protein